MIEDNDPFDFDSLDGLNDLSRSWNRWLREGYVKDTIGYSILKIIFKSWILDFLIYQW